MVGYPNFFGVVEDLDAIGTLAHAHGALLVTATAEALALGLLKSPGAFGADIAVAEGQSFGMPMSYGGPGVGLFATRSDYVRIMPGRLVGEAVDGAGRRGYVLTLATREQHIRREKATSNICTNHGLIALAVTVYLSTARQGRPARAGHRQHCGGAPRGAASGARPASGGSSSAAPFFNEFVVARARRRGRLGGGAARAVCSPACRCAAGIRS